MIPRPGVGWVLSMLFLAGFVTGTMVAAWTRDQAIDAQAQTIVDLQLKADEDMKTICSYADQLVRQHEVVQHVWPGALKPTGQRALCEARGYLMPDRTLR